MLHQTRAAWRWIVKGSMVMDCFCGSGTTLVAAQELGRNWIGIDQSDQAIKVAQNKLAQVTAGLFSQVEYELLREQK